MFSSIDVVLAMGFGVQGLGLRVVLLLGAHLPVGAHDLLKVDSIHLAKRACARLVVCAVGVELALHTGLPIHQEDVACRLGLHPAQ